MPNFRGSDITVAHSPDGIYKGLVIHLPNEWINRKRTFFDIFFSSRRSTWGVLMDAETEEVKAFYSFDRDWQTFGGGVWVCDEPRSGCYKRYFGYEEDGASLPPSLWRQAHAKLVVIFWGFDIAEMKSQQIYCHNQPVLSPIKVVCSNQPDDEPFGLVDPSVPRD